ncbi:MAG: flagellar assembly protein FliW [Lentisphaeraceae bacterium]|nr:flagellar assembly protein FliW [Lentisphaeraceae bacterium]
MNITQTIEKSVVLSAADQYRGFSEALEGITKDEVTFSNGLSAFEDYKCFTYRKEMRLKPFIYMHSSFDSNVSFVCVDPFILTPSYKVTLSEDTIRNLEINDESKVIILCLVSVGKDMYTTTANLMSPIVINASIMKGEQVIMEDLGPEYLRYNVWNSIGQNNMAMTRK